MKLFIRSSLVILMALFLSAFQYSDAMLEKSSAAALAESQKQLNLTEEEKRWLKTHPVITVAVKHGYSPIEFIFELKEFRGISIDYLKKFETLLGVKFTKTMAQESAAANHTDMVSAVNSPAALEGSEFVTMDTPFLVSSVGIFTSVNAEKVNDIQALYGKKVAVFKNGHIAKHLAADHPKIILYRVDIAEEALDALMTGKVDAYIGNTVIIKYVLKSREIDNIEYSADTPYQSEVFMGVRRDWPLLKSILEKALRAISEQEKAVIVNKWTSVSDAGKINYRLLSAVLLVSLAIVTIFAVWNRRLKKEVNYRMALEKSLIQSKVKAEQAEETIRRYSMDLERLAMVAENTTDSVIITNAQGLTIWVNRAFIQATGFTLQDMLGKKPGSVLQGKDTSQEAVKLLHDAISRLQDIKVDIVNYKKSGEKYWISLKITSTENSVGERVFIAIQTDITQQVEYIETIKKNQEDMDAIFSLSPDGVVVLDSEHLVSHVNQSFTAMTGLDGKALIGLSDKKFDQLLRQLCTQPKEYKSLLDFKETSASHAAVTESRGTIVDGDFKFQIRTPVIRTLERSSIQINQKRISRVIYFKDVTQKVMLENMKSEFITTAAHELRTPMAVILGYAELLKMKTFKQETQAEMIDAIHAKSKIVSSLLDDLLDVAIIEYRAEKSLKLELKAIAPFIHSIAQTFIFPSNKNRINLAPVPELPEFFFDSQKLERAINNCLTNAYKFSPQTGRVSMRLYLTESKSPELAIEIKDEGIGMSQEELARIFEKFYRADKTGHVPGTGLGMVLVKDIMEAHGGRVLVESTLNVGTTVTLIMPIRQSID